MSDRATRWSRAAAPVVVTAAFLAVMPTFAPNAYNLTVFTNLCVNLILLVGLNIISGYGGQLSLGQAAFYGIGAYTVTVGMAKHGVDPLLCFFLAPVLAAAFAVVVGVPSLRLRGLYFAMATLGVGVIVQLYLERATHETGGPNGLGIRPLTVGGLNFGQPRTLYIGAAVIAVLGVLVAQLFVRTRAGWGLRAAHASEPAAYVVGVNIFGVRLLAFAISGAYAGVAGAIQAFNSLYVSPSTFNFFTSVLLFIVLAIGGLATWAGPLFGAILLLIFDRWLTAYVDKEPLILAAIFVLSLRLFPRGIARAAVPLAERLRGRRVAEGAVARSESA